MLLALASLAALPRAAGASPTTSPRLPTARDTSHDLAARAALARIDRDTRAADLAGTETIRLPDGDVIVRFDQTYRGLPVLDHGAAVRLAPNGVTVVGRAHVELDLPSSVVPRVSREAAALAAARILRLDVAVEDAALVVAPLRGGGSRLAWSVAPRFPFPSAPLLLIDAVDGHLLRAVQRAVSDHRAEVYVDNPVRTPVRLLQDLPIDTKGDYLESAEVKSFNCVDKGTIAHVSDGDGRISLRVCDLVESATADADGLFSAEPDDDPADTTHLEDPYSEVSMYFHVTRAYQFFRDLRGDPTAAVVDAAPLIAVANLRVVKGLEAGDLDDATDPSSPLVPFGNAFFTPSGQGFGIFYGVSGGSMWFGQGKVRDYAYDGDVVYHEFTHGVIDKTLGLGEYTLDRYGLFDAPGAMNEALADYFSSALAGDPEVGEYASRDIQDDGLPIRTLANDDTCPGHVIGEAHFDSSPFSGGLYAARSRLPAERRRDFDAALYATMLAHPHQRDPGYADLLGLFLDTLATRLPEAHDVLQAEMQYRGLLPECTRILRLVGGEVAAPSDRYGDFGYSAPGSYVVGDDQGETPGVMQVEVPLDGSARHMAIRFIGRDAPEGLGSPRGTPFRPTLLVKMGHAITWSVSKGNLHHDADLDVAPTMVNGAYEAVFDVPAGTAILYAQVVNHGVQDGLYDHIAAGDPTPPPPADAPPDPPAATNDGCSCTTAGHDGPGSHASGLGAALAILALGRRKARSRSAARVVNSVRG